MAARLNTRLIAIVAVAVVGAGALIGGFAILRFRADVTRHVKQGEAFMAAGEYDRAVGAFGRALSKQPGNIQFVELTLEALRQHVPRTQSELRERFNLLQQLMEKRVGIAPLRADLHMELIDFQHTLALLDRRNMAGWQRLEELAQRMADQIDPNDPAQLDAKLMKAVAVIGRRGAVDQRRLDEALAQVREVIAARPTDDLAHATLVTTLIAEGERRRLADRTDIRAIELIEDGQKALREAVEKVPAGALVASAELAELIRDRAVRGVADEARIESAARRLAESVPGLASEWQIDQAVGPILSLGSASAAKTVSDALDALIARRPDSITARQMLTATAYISGDLDRAAAAAEAVLSAPALPVGLPAMLQPEAKLAAATTLFDIDFSRLTELSAEEQRAAYPRINAALARVRELSERPESDIRLLRSEGRLALLLERWTEAQNRYETIIRQLGETSVSPDILFESAVAASRAGDSGLAKRRIDQCVVALPDFLAALLLKAELEQRTGDLEAARRTAARARQVAPNDPRVLALGQALEQSGVDTVARQLRQIQQRAERGDLSAAKALAAEALVSAPGDSRLLRAAAFIEVLMGENAAALELANRGLESAPDDELLRRLVVIASTDDPVQRIVAVIEAENPPGELRTARTYAALSRAAADQRILVTNLEQTEAPQLAEAKSVLDQLEAAAERFAGEARAIDPPPPVVVVMDFDRAIIARDLAAAAAVVEAERKRDGSEMTDAELAGMEARVLLARAEYEAAREPRRRRELLGDAVRLLEQALNRNPEATELRALLGQVQFRVGNLQAALASLETAHSRRPTDMAIVESYGAVLQNLGEQTRLLQVLRDASRQPGVTMAVRNNWLVAEAAFGDRRAALRERRLIQQAAPDDLGNGLALSTLLLTLPPARELIVDGSGRERINVDRWQGMTPEQQRAALEALRREWLDEADLLLQRLAATYPKSFEVRGVMADLARARGRADQGEQILRRAIIDAGGDATARMHLALGAYLVSIGRASAAQPSFDAALSLQKANEADRFLAGIAMQQGDVAAAIPHLRAVAQSSGEMRERLAYAEALLRIGEFDQAEAEIQRAVADLGMDGDASMLEATLVSQRLDRLVRAGETDLAALDARLDAALRRAAELRPNDPAPLVGQAQSLIGRWQRRADRQPTDKALDEALVLVDRAVAMRADYWPAARLRAQILNSRGDVVRARTEVERVVRIAPSNDEARAALIELWVASRALDRAVVVAREGIDIRPLDPRAHRQLGELLDRAGDVNGAIAAHRRAMELEPGAPIDRLVMLLLKRTPARQPDFAAAMDLLQQRPDAVQRSVYLQAALGAAMVGSGRRAEGIEQLRRAYAAYKQATADRPQLINGWFEQLWLVTPPERTDEAEALVRELGGGTLGPFEKREIAVQNTKRGPAGFAKAIALLREAIAEASGLPPETLAGLRFDLGAAYFNAGQCVPAIESFEDGLRLAPDNPAILNNLAYLLAECTNDHAKALPFAERAVRLAPGEASFHDTLGMILTELGELDRAERALKTAMEIARSAEFHVNLAAVYAKQNRRNEARGELRRAGELDPKVRDSERYKRIESAVGR